MTLVLTLSETRSTCPYCGVGCGVIIDIEGDQITGVRGDPDHPANFGRLCTKGSHAAPDGHAPSRCRPGCCSPTARAQRATRGTRI
jgi:assimilatory nitrate reductase catalytic subunit